jgi:hypothetical protein
MYEPVRTLAMTHSIRKTTAQVPVQEEVEIIAGVSGSVYPGALNLQGAYGPEA